MASENEKDFIWDKGMGDECPVKKTLELLAGKWTTRVIYELQMNTTLRFGEFKRNIPEITNAMLSSTLKELEGKGIVSRTQFNEVPLRVEYSLTKAGQEMMPIFSEMGRWGANYLK